MLRGVLVVVTVGCQLKILHHNYGQDNYGQEREKEKRKLERENERGREREEERERGGRERAMTTVLAH